MRNARPTELVMGSAQLGLTYGAANRTGKPEREAALRLVQRAADAGVETFDTARAYGLNDRGQLKPGLLADINVIDFEGLALHRPIAVDDLPAGGRRLVQRPEGYRYTIKSGQVTFEDGEHTGALPGGLVRGGREAVILPIAAE
jgi:N-acyl-D-aspartate/D-glutamate deacylase